MSLRSSVLIAMLAFASSFPAARAMSLKDFQAMTPDAQGRYVADYVLKMKTDIAPKNPALADAIWAYFTRDVPGKPTTPGTEDLLVQEMVVDKLAKEGKADPAAIQIEGMIAYVVKQHFRAYHRSIS